MEIETKSASLDTLAVTIQALHVNGKQMTLAVFRQLPIVSAYNQDYTIADFRFWGIVRYEIKNEGKIWAVADKDGLLYRCNVNSFIDYTERGLNRDIQCYQEQIEALKERIIHVDCKILETQDDEEKFYFYGKRHWIDEKDKLLNNINCKQSDMEHCIDCLLLVRNEAKTKTYLLSLPQLFIAV